jgi:RES domain
MSSNTWMQGALSSSTCALTGLCWRVVEAQSKISTMKLSDTLEEQEALERLIEETKQAIPDECRHLDFLLFTPFRYAPYPFDSRFRRAGSPDGVFYGAEMPETSIAEKVFYRLLFFHESPGTPWPENPGEYTAFAARFASVKAVDLTQPPWLDNRSAWANPTDYSACLRLADACRGAGVDVIRYESVRAPGSYNLALLRCRVFTRRDPVSRQTWRIHFGASGARARCEAPSRTIAFDRTAFASDPRIGGFDWDRPAPRRSRRVTPTG